MSSAWSSVADLASEGIEVPFLENHDGVLFRRVDEVDQILAPLSFRSGVLHLSHHARTAGYPGSPKLYHPLRKLYCWPSMALYCYSTASGCPICAQN